jgi:RimJ/RimL family protein N-acetyltransferase
MSGKSGGGRRFEIMQHKLQAEAFWVRLRPVRMDDAPFIVWLRNLDHAKGRVGDSATDAASQERWLKAYFDRPGDYYFIIETAGGIAVGAYGIYDLKASSAESGRWVIRPDVPAAIPNAMLAFDIAFDRLDLTELRVTTVSTNRPMLSLNRKLGFRQTGITKNAQLIGGQAVDLVHFLLDRNDWPKVRADILPLAHVAEKQVRDWEEAQRRARTEPSPGTGEMGRGS